MAGNMNLGRLEHAEISFGRKYSRQNSARIRTALNPLAYPDMLTSADPDDFCARIDQIGCALADDRRSAACRPDPRISGGRSGST
jgi:hypothetical protein